MVKKFESRYDSVPLEREVELFTWEKTDRVDEVKKAFGIA